MCSSVDAHRCERFLKKIGALLDVAICPASDAAMELWARMEVREPELNHKCVLWAHECIWFFQPRLADCAPYPPSTDYTCDDLGPPDSRFGCDRSSVSRFTSAAPSWRDQSPDALMLRGSNRMWLRRWRLGLQVLLGSPSRQDPFGGFRIVAGHLFLRSLELLNGLNIFAGQLVLARGELLDGLRILS